MARQWKIRPPLPKTLSPADLTLKEQLLVLSWRTRLPYKKVAKRYSLTKERVRHNRGNLAPVLEYLTPSEKAKIVCGRAGIHFNRDTDKLPADALRKLSRQADFLRRYRLR